MFTNHLSIAAAQRKEWVEPPSARRRGLQSSRITFFLLVAGFFSTGVLADVERRDEPPRLDFQVFPTLVDGEAPPISKTIRKVDNGWVLAEGNPDNDETLERIEVYFKPNGNFLALGAKMLHSIFPPSDKVKAGWKEGIYNCRRNAIFDHGSRLLVGYTICKSWLTKDTTEHSSKLVEGILFNGGWSGSIQIDADLVLKAFRDSGAEREVEQWRYDAYRADYQNATTPLAIEEFRARYASYDPDNLMPALPFPIPVRTISAGTDIR